MEAVGPLEWAVQIWEGNNSMLILRWIDNYSGQLRMVEELTTRIAARCEPAVAARIYPTAATMDPAQARGYIRARSLLVISRELAIAAATTPELTESVQTRVKAAVADQLVRTNLAEIATQHPARWSEARAA